MLCLSRRRGESIQIGDAAPILVTVIGIQDGKVRLGIEAPTNVPIMRTELLGDPCSFCHGSGRTIGELPDLAMETSTTCPKCGGSGRA